MDDLEKEIRQIMLNSNINQADIANKLNMSQQNFSKKLKAGTLRLNEFLALLELANYKMIIQKKDDRQA